LSAGERQNALIGMRPFLSAIIVTHNAAPFVADCLQSLRRACLRLQQATGQTAEIIVVDNASCDETIAVVRRFPDVTLLVNEDNEGFAAGINRGAQLASGEWLLVLNPDCVLDENALVALHDFLAPHPSSPDPHRIGVVGFQLLHPDGRLQPSGRRFPKVWEFALAALGFQRLMEARWFRGRNFSVPQEVDEVSGAAFAIRRAAFEQVGGMDDGFFLFFEELDLCRRLKAAGWRIVSLPTAKASHAWGASVKRVPALARLAQQHSALRYFRRHHGCAAAMLVRFALLLQLLGRFLRRPQRWHLVSLRLLLSPPHPFRHWRQLLR
jgi:N-acetylglucosaminyl-diphospho-decaprenol L-rhamnosyltransferase